MNLKFEILGEPTAKGRPKYSARGGFPRAYTPAKTRAAESNMRAQIAAQLPSGYVPSEKAMKMSIRIYRSKPKSAKKTDLHPKQKPDLDNYLKLILDAMNTIVFKDDSQIIEIHATKEYSSVPRIEIEAEEVN